MRLATAPSEACTRASQTHTAPDPAGPTRPHQALCRFESVRGVQGLTYWCTLVICLGQRIQFLHGVPASSPLSPPHPQSLPHSQPRQRPRARSKCGLLQSTAESSPSYPAAAARGTDDYILLLARVQSPPTQSGACGRAGSQRQPEDSHQIVSCAVVRRSSAQEGASICARLIDGALCMLISRVAGPMRERITPSNPTNSAACMQRVDQQCGAVLRASSAGESCAWDACNALSPPAAGGRASHGAKTGCGTMCSLHACHKALG